MFHPFFLSSLFWVSCLSSIVASFLHSCFPVVTISKACVLSATVYKKFLRDRSSDTTWDSVGSIRLSGHQLTPGVFQDSSSVQEVSKTPGVFRRLPRLRRYSRNHMLQGRFPRPTVVGVRGFQDCSCFQEISKTSVLSKRFPRLQLAPGGSRNFQLLPGGLQGFSSLQERFWIHHFISKRFPRESLFSRKFFEISAISRRLPEGLQYSSFHGSFQIPSFLLGVFRASVFVKKLLGFSCLYEVLQGFSLPICPRTTETGNVGIKLLGLGKVEAREKRTEG